MKNLTSAILLTSMLFLAGCATPISPEEIANADYGAPPPKNYKALIKESFGPLLIDPTSPLYTFSPPAKGYFMASSFADTQKMFGWRVCGTINSKNRMGGYTGSSPFIVLFRDGQIAQQKIGKPYDIQEGFFENNAIINACKRKAGK